MNQDDYDKGYTKALQDVQRLLRAINESRVVAFSYANAMRLLEIAMDDKRKVLQEGDLSDIYYDRLSGFHVVGRD